MISWNAIPDISFYYCILRADNARNICIWLPLQSRINYCVLFELIGSFTISRSNNHQSIFFNYFFCLCALARYMQIRCMNVWKICNCQFKAICIKIFLPLQKSNKTIDRIIGRKKHEWLIWLLFREIRFRIVNLHSSIMSNDRCSICKGLITDVQRLHEHLIYLQSECLLGIPFLNYKCIDVWLNTFDGNLNNNRYIGWPLYRFLLGERFALAWNDDQKNVINNPKNSPNIMVWLFLPFFLLSIDIGEWEMFLQCASIYSTFYFHGAIHLPVDYWLESRCEKLKKFWLKFWFIYYITFILIREGNLDECETFQKKFIICFESTIKRIPSGLIKKTHA